MAVSLLFGIYCLEAGLFFVVVPWTRFWALNPLLHALPSLALMVDNPYFRGLVSGFGVVHLIIGVREFADFLAVRRHSRVGK